MIFYNYKFILPWNFEQRLKNTIFSGYLINSIIIEFPMGLQQENRVYKSKYCECFYN